MPDGVRVAIWVTPRAARDRLVGLAATAAGGTVLKVAVSAPPEAGRANEALLRLLAQAWHLRRAELELVAGAARRDKLVHIAGDPGLLTKRLAAALAALPRA